MMVKNLKNVMEALEESEAKEKEDVTVDPTPGKRSEMTTDRTEKILRERTGESVLSKAHSRRNFRVKTVAASHE